MTEQARGPGTSTTIRSVLKINGLVAGYGGGDVLRGVSLDVPAGGITCVVGPNGAGKSTLMATISGLLRPRLGSMLLDGQDLAGRSPRQVLRLGVVQVPQNHSLFRDMTVRENVELGGYILSDRALTARGSRPSSTCSRRSPGGPGRRPAACPAGSSGWSSSPAR